MNTQLLEDAAARVALDRAHSPSEIASDVAYQRIVFVNVYFIGRPNSRWTLIDTGLPWSASRIIRTVEDRYGKGARPASILLTHGHFDHAGSAKALADHWDVPIYAHRLEMPFLTGKSDYPPADPTVGGALAFLSRGMPTKGQDLGNRVSLLPADGSVPGLPGWRWYHTPGHTAGHVSYFRESDRMLIAGDALATVNQESAVTMVTLTPELRNPPLPMTTDWRAARESVELLASLHPSAIAAGHGVPVTGPQLASSLQEFADHFLPPSHGRYAHVPAVSNEDGVQYVPPTVPDPLPKIAAGIAVAGLGLWAAWRFSKRYPASRS